MDVFPAKSITDSRAIIQMDETIKQLQGKALLESADYLLGDRPAKSSTHCKTKLQNVE